MKLGVNDRKECCLVCVKFHLNHCRFADAVAICLGGSLFLGHSVDIDVDDVLLVVDGLVFPLICHLLEIII